MRIKRIELLSDYKCFKKGTVFNFFDTPIICIVGKNSTGKTIFLKMLSNIITVINSYYVKKQFNNSYNLNNSNSNLSNQSNFDFKIEFDNEGMNYEVTREKGQIRGSTLPFGKDAGVGISMIPGRDIHLNFLTNLNKYSQNILPKNSIIFNKALSYVDLKYDYWENFYINETVKLFKSDLSEGEKSIIDIFSLFPEKHYGNEENLYLLDEPDKYLNNDLKRKYISLLQEAINEKDQIIFTTHSTELISDLEEIQVYKCENYEIENINFNPFGEDSSTLTEKLFDDKFGISDIAQKTYNEFRMKIKATNDVEQLKNLKKEINYKFPDTIYSNDLIKLINNKIKE